jgi:hypothetical protein
MDCYGRLPELGAIAMFEMVRRSGAHRAVTVTQTVANTGSLPSLTST